MAGVIKIGTASWTDKPLIESGKFYPADAKTPEARLRYYASRYPLVEADTTYYGLPTEQLARGWVERTPDGFTFDVKAYSLFTNHPTPVVRLPKTIQEALPGKLAGKRQFYREEAPKQVVDLCWSTFIDALFPLYDAGRLGVIVFQFPKWVFPGQDTFDYLEEVRDRLGPYAAAVEFRNDLWMDAEHQETTVQQLGDLGFTYICVDEPQGFRSSVPPVALATTPERSFVRFHGRNAETWEKRTRTSSERFDYYYTAAELAEWTPKIARLAEETAEVHLVMNTNNSDQGPVNSDLLRKTLESAGLETMAWPPPLPGTAADGPSNADDDAGQGRLL